MLNLSKKINNGVSRSENSASRIRIWGNKELYTDFGLKDISAEEIGEGLSIDTYQRNSRIRFLDLNLMNDENISFENEKLILCFDNDIEIETTSGCDFIPAIDSIKQESIYDNVIELILKSKELRIETHLGTYAIYDISFFNELPPKNGTEWAEKLEKMKKEQNK